MIPVGRVAKPQGYDAVKRRGDAWLRANPHAKHPQDLWSPYLSHLASGFSHRCGYAAMLDPTGGSVDHYLSWHQHPDLAYDWSNFRFVSSILNASKRTADDAVLDPYLVQSGWFEILLPSLQMRLTSNVPAKHRAKAEYTLKRLKLRDGEKVIRWRRHYYGAYQQGKLDLDGLREWAPLIAEAVERTMTVAGSPRKRRTRQRRRAKATISR